MLKKPKCRGCGKEENLEFYRGYWWCKICLPLIKKGIIVPIDIMEI